jgi:hypothetical protein
MDKKELYEEIRALLLEPLSEVGADEWKFSEVELVRQVRSAIRRVRIAGIPIAQEMSEEGELSEELTFDVGMLIAYSVVARLLRGYLTQQLLDGELGIMWRAGQDVIDTKTAGQGFQRKASEYELEYQGLLATIFANRDGGTNSVFGGPTTM